MSPDLVLVHFRSRLLQLMRLPAFAIPTLILPALFYLFFGVPNSPYRDVANFYLTAYAAFAVIGVGFFHFGVGTAVERGGAWEQYLRTLPLRPATRIVANVMAAAVFAAVAVALVVLTATVFTKAGFHAGVWLAWSAALLAGAVPFVLIGMTIGYAVAPQAAAPVANLLYLPLSFLGGLFISPSSLPPLAARISPFLPSRQYAEVAWSVANGRPLPWASVLGLLLYTGVFGVLAVRGYQRDARAKS